MAENGFGLIPTPCCLLGSDTGIVWQMSVDPEKRGKFKKKFKKSLNLALP